LLVGVLVALVLVWQVGELPGPGHEQPVRVRGSVVRSCRRFGCFPGDPGRLVRGNLVMLTGVQPFARAHVPTVNDLGASGPAALVTQDLGHITLQESVKVQMAPELDRWPRH
jgi:hypothetical protein